MIRAFDLMRRLRAGVASVLLLSATGSYALNTATIVGSVASPDCLEYRVVGICYWLYCTWTGCTVRTSIKVRHYIPDAVVSSYSNTGENPWVEVRAMSTPNPSAQAGGDGNCQRHPSPTRRRTGDRTDRGTGPVDPAGLRSGAAGIRNVHRIAAGCGCQCRQGLH